MFKPLITQKIGHDAIFAFSTLGAGSLNPRAVSVKNAYLNKRRHLSNDRQCHCYDFFEMFQMMTSKIDTRTRIILLQKFFFNITHIWRNDELKDNLTLSASICGYLLIKCCLLTRNDYRRILRLWSLSKKSLDYLQISRSVKFFRHSNRIVVWDYIPVRIYMYMYFLVTPLFSENGIYSKPLAIVLE